MATSIRTNRTVRNYKVTVPAGQTVDIESVDFSKFSATKYLLEYSNSSNSVFKAIELIASKKSNDVNDSIYSKIGNAINVETHVLKIGSEVRVRVVNNEAFDLLASFSKILT